MAIKRSQFSVFSYLKRHKKALFRATKLQKTRIKRLVRQLRGQTPLIKMTRPLKGTAPFVVKAVKNVFKFAHLRPAVIASLIVAIVATNVFIWFRPQVALGQTYAFSQSDWSGGAAGDTVNAPSNLSGWNKYASANAVTAGAGSVGLTPNQTIFSDSFNASTFKDTASTTANWNTGTGRIEVPPVTAYVASDNYWQLNGPLAGGNIRLLADSANGAVYGVSGSGGFIKYDIASGVLTDLRVTSGLYAFWGENYINSLVFGPGNNSIYLFGPNGSFAVYDIASNTATDLRTSSGLSVFWGTNPGLSLVFDSSASKVYLGGLNSNFAVYDIASNTATNLAVVSGLSGFWSGTSLQVNTLAWDQLNSKIYLAGGQDFSGRIKFAVYDIASNTATDLYSTSGLSAIFTQYQVQAIAVNPVNHLVYLVGGGNLSNESKFAVYDPGTNTATDLYVTSGLKAFFTYPQLYAVTVDPSNGKVYLAGGYGSFAVYTPGTPGTAVNLAITSGLSVFLNGSTGDDSNGATYSLAFDSVGSRVFLGGFYHLTSYAIGSPGVATNLSAKVSPYGWNGKNIYASVYNPANGLIYLTGDGARLLSYNPVSGVYVNLSASSGLPALAFGVNAIVLGPGNTKLYLVTYGKLIVYDIATNVATNVSASSGLSAFMGSTSILTEAVDASSGKVYLGGAGNALAVYDIATNVATNLSVTSGLSGFWSSNDVISLVFASVGRKLYLGGKNGYFAVYDPVGGVSTDLRTTSGLSVFWGTDYVTAMAYDSNNDKLYLGGSNSRFAVYTPGSPGTSVDISTTSGLRSFGSSGYMMAFDPVNSKIYISGYGTLAVYQISNNTATNLTVTSGLSALSFSSIYSVVVDSAGTNVYPTSLYGHLAKISAPCSACVAVSLPADSTTQNIKSATLTKTDTVGTGTLAYRLSNDGGATYNTVTPGSLYTFSTVGSDLRFQVAITGNATVQDIAIAYDYYAADGSLTSSKFDSTDTANIVNRLTWDEDTSLPVGATATVSLRTADVSTNLTGAWTDLTSASANCSKSGTTVTCTAVALPAGLQDGSNDRWFQYKISLASDGRNSATVSSVGIQFVVNAAPQVRNVTAVQNANGTVTINYEVRDPDTAAGSPANRDHVTPSFEYWDGSAYRAIATLATGDTDPKAVAHSGDWNDVVYTATWTPSADFPGHYMNGTAKIRATASDNEGANPTGSAESALYTLDSSAPASSAITIDASTTPATVHLASVDDNAVTMKVSSSDPTLGSTASEPFATTKTMALSEGATVYARFTDAFQNSTGIMSALVPATPTAVMIQDNSNILSDPHLYRLFVAWKVVTGPFASYRVHRSTSLDNPSGWPEVATINTRAINYFLDDNVGDAGEHYYYYVDTVDASGNISFRSTVVDGIADGAQSGGEGGGGIGPAPTISNVSFGTPQATSATIVWNTDTLSDSTVSYSTTPSVFTTSVYIGSLVNSDSGVGRHEVVLTGLLPETTYYFRVSSKDINDQVTSDSNGPSGYSFTTPGGPVIANTSVEQTTNTTARISWTTNVPATSELVRSIHADMSSPSFTTGTSDPTTDHVVNLTNLQAGTMYFFYVSSVDTNSSATTDKRVVNGVPQYYSFTTTNDTTPPAISAVSVRVQPTSADIIWTTDKPSDSQVEYGLTTAYGTLTALETTTTTRHVVTLTGLNPETAYAYRIRSRDMNSVQAISGNLTFTTLAAGDAVPPVISGVMVSSLSLNSASINWETDENATSYVDYGPTASLGSSVGSDTLTGEHSVTLDGLSGNATYYYRVRSADAAGNSAFDDNNGAHYSFATATDSVSPIISGTDDVILMNSFRVLWTTNELADSQIEYGLDTGYGQTSALNEALLLEHSVAVSALAPATAYHYRILTRDASGNLATGPDRTVTTANQADNDPPVISAVASSAISRTAATITWTTDEKSSSQVQYGPNLTYGYTATNINDNALGHSVELGGLSPGTEYFFKVVSADGSGNIASNDNVGAGYSFTTIIDSDAPAISHVTAALISDTSAVITWDTDEASTSQVVYGATSAYGSQTAVFPALTGSHTITVSGLEKQTKYYYKVVSADAYTNSTTDDNGGAGYTFTTTDVPGGVRSSHPSSRDTSPPVITNLRVGSIGKTMAIVEWNTDEPADTILKYGPTIAYGTLAGSVDEKIMAHQVNLSGLVSGTIYHFIAVSTDASGNQAVTADRYFATLKEDGSVVPLPLQPETSETAPAGNVTPPASVPPVTANQNANTPSATPADPKTNSILMTMDSLQDIVHQMLANANTPTSIDAFNQTVSDLVDKLIQPPLIVGLAPTVRFSGTTATISWTTDKKTGGLVGYTPSVDYHGQTAEPYISFASEPPGTLDLIHEVTLTNLEPATTYHFQVRSKGMVGSEAKSKDATFVTPSVLPEITDFTIAKISDLSAMLDWKTNVPTSASVEYVNTATRTALTQGDPAFLRDHTFKLDKLESGAPYKVIVTATDENGNQAKSKELTVSTSKDKNPPVISKVTSESTLYPGKESRVQTIISWQTDEPASTRVTYQEGLSADAKIIEIPVDASLVTKHTVVITKFRPTTVYKFWAESADASGNNAKSTDFLILTPQQKATVVDMIIKNFESVFGWTKGLSK